MNTELEQFCQLGDRIADTYERQSKRLRAFLADLRKEASGQQDFLSINMLGHSIQMPFAGERNGKPTEPAPATPQTVTAWIRFAIGRNPDRVTVPEIITTILAASGKKVASERVSITLYQLSKAGELTVVERRPGKPSIYRATPNFKSWDKSTAPVKVSTDESE